MGSTVKFVPNQGAKSTAFPTNEDFLKYVAERFRQNPETVAFIQFSELESELTTVDTNVRVEGIPVPMDVFGDFSTQLVEEEKPSKLGERLADELESFEPIDASEIVTNTTAYIVGEDFEPARVVIESEEVIKGLERQATGQGE